MQVADWKTFWAMFNNWLWVYQQLMYLEENKLAIDSEVVEQMQWLQIDREILVGRVDKVSLLLFHSHRCIIKAAAAVP